MTAFNFAYLGFLFYRSFLNTIRKLEYKSRIDSEKKTYKDKN